MTKPIRAFFAVELNDTVRAKLDMLLSDLRCTRVRVSWTKPENLHLTLRFLGDVELPLLESVTRNLGPALDDSEPFLLHIRDLGAFPSLTRPRTLWSGVQGELARLAQTQSRIEHTCHAAGLAAESRPFHPHVTLGRVRNAAKLNDLVQIMHRHQAFDGGELLVSAVTLFSSTTHRNGAIYEKLREFRLT